MTDPTVYTPNRDLDQADIKKRKRGLDGEIANGYGVDGNTGSGALYTGQVKTNAHLRTIHAELKGEYEELGCLCVSRPIQIAVLDAPLRIATGKAKVVGEPNDAQVSSVLFVLLLPLTCGLGSKSAWPSSDKSVPNNPIVFSTAAIILVRYR